MCAIGEASGPMLKGMTYKVRRLMLPLNTRVRVFFICTGFT
jgi:hypothetical protein